VGGTKPSSLTHLAWRRRRRRRRRRREIYPLVKAILRGDGTVPLIKLGPAALSSHTVITPMES